MRSYKTAPPTAEECKKWLLNKTINPRTNREIAVNGPTYKYLQQESVRVDEDSMSSIFGVKLEDGRQAILGWFTNEHIPILESLGGKFHGDIRVIGWVFPSNINISDTVQLLNTTSEIS